MTTVGCGHSRCKPLYVGAPELECPDCHARFRIVADEGGAPCPLPVNSGSGAPVSTDAGRREVSRDGVASFVLKTVADAIDQGGWVYCDDKNTERAIEEAFARIVENLRKAIEESTA